MPDRPGCAWIEGEPHGERTQYCGRPTVNGTWCAYHHQRVYKGGEPDDEPAAAPAER